MKSNLFTTTEKHILNNIVSNAYHSIGMDLGSVVYEDVLQDPWAPLAVLRQPLGPRPPEEVEVVPVGVDGGAGRFDLAPT